MLWRRESSSASPSNADQDSAVVTGTLVQTTALALVVREMNTRTFLWRAASRRATPPVSSELPSLTINIS